MELSAAQRLRLETRVDLLRQLEGVLARDDDPDIPLLGAVRELLMEAEAELED